MPLDEVIDATGAGDAFLGGLIAGNYYLLNNHKINISI